MPGRKEVRGGAGTLTLASGITAVSASLQANGSVAGWPTGALYPFVIKIDAAGVEEKCLCSALTGASPATITITTRGYDGTAAAIHAANVNVQHCIDADTLDTLFAHEFDITRDDHTQYMKTDGTRAFSGVSALVGTPQPVGVATSDGSALTFARSDHLHRLANGAVDLSTIFAAGVVNNAALGANAVTTDKILDGTILPADLAVWPVFRGDTGAVQSVGSGVGVTLKVTSVTQDTHFAYNASTGIYTAPITGLYLIAWGITMPPSVPAGVLMRCYNSIGAAPILPASRYVPANIVNSGGDPSLVMNVAVGFATAGDPISPFIQPGGTFTTFTTSMLNSLQIAYLHP